MIVAARVRRVVTAAELSQLRGDVTDRLADAEWAWRAPLADRPAILAFDCGKDTGWACINANGFACGGFRSHTGGPGDDGWADELEGKVGSFAEGVSTAPAALVVVEDVFLARGPKMNPATMAGIAYYVGAVIHEAARWQLPVLRVKPSEWQSKMVGGKRAREQGKLLSIDVARQHYGAAIRNDHMADAALLAAFARGSFR